MTLSVFRIGKLREKRIVIMSLKLVLGIFVVLKFGSMNKPQKLSRLSFSPTIYPTTIFRRQTAYMEVL